MSVTCQVCGESVIMSRVLSLGYMPPPNEMQVGEYNPQPQVWLPTEMWFCSACQLAQLGCVPDKRVAFPYDYPYLSQMSGELLANFKDLAEKVFAKIDLEPHDLVVDIGSNDGSLLSYFKDWVRVLGVEPTIASEVAEQRGIPTRRDFFSHDIARRIIAINGTARVVTCTNCFAHMPLIGNVIEAVKTLLGPGGLFVTESHYLVDLIDKLQYDTIYAEHLRYYTLGSLEKLFAKHGMQIVDFERIPTHGGSIRVYAQKAGEGSFYPTAFDEPYEGELEQRLGQFARDIRYSKWRLLSHLNHIKQQGARIVGIGAPTRGSTVINYCGLDSSIIEYVAEQPHSPKIGRFMPGTDIPVVDEQRLFKDPPDAAILFSWHLADTLIPKLRSKGYHGEIILPCSVTIVHEDASVEIA